MIAEKFQMLSEVTSWEVDIMIDAILAQGQYQIGKNVYHSLQER